MKALIFPFQQTEALAPLRSLCPDFLLPLAGKPMVEHLVEQLVTAGIPDVTLLCDDRTEEVVRHFGNGERWGCALTLSAVRDQGGLQRMVRAALHGVAGTIVCLPGNLAVSHKLSGLLAGLATGSGIGATLTVASGAVIAADAEILRAVSEEQGFETMEQLAELVRHKETYDGDPRDLPHLHLEGEGTKKLQTLHRITDLSGFLAAQCNILEGTLTGSRIPGRLVSEGIWIGDHVQLSPDVRLVAPLLIGNHCQISGSGQIGPNAVIAPYCLVNNSDLICDSLIMSGTATGSHTELNGMAARGSVLVNLRSGATVTSPDAFILGTVRSENEPAGGDSTGSLPTLLLLIILLPLGLPLLLLSCLVPGLMRRDMRLGNRRMKTLTGDNPRVPFTLRQFSFGPLLLRRWPGFCAVLAGNLTLVGAAAAPAGAPDQAGCDSVFGLDTARGLFHVWEVEGELPESLDEQHARENFHAVTRTLAADLKIILRAATTFPPAG